LKNHLPEITSIPWDPIKIKKTMEIMFFQIKTMKIIRKTCFSSFFDENHVFSQKNNENQRISSFSNKIE